MAMVIAMFTPGRPPGDVSPHSQAEAVPPSQSSGPSQLEQPSEATHSERLAPDDDGGCSEKAGCSGYGRRIVVEFRHKRRAEARFPALASLTRQIRADADAARAYFAASRAAD